MKILGRQIWEYRDTGDKVVVTRIDAYGDVWFLFLPERSLDGLRPVLGFNKALKLIGWDGGPFPKDDLHSCPVCGGRNGCFMVPSLFRDIYMGSKCHGAFKLGEN